MKVRPSRITAALDAARCTGPRVDKVLGGVEPMVDEWEAGRLEPHPLQVFWLAELTGVDLGWLLDPPAAPGTRGAAPVSPTLAQLRECLLGILGDEPGHAWATPTIQAAFAWRECARVQAQLRRLETFGLVASWARGPGHPTWWWLAGALKDDVRCHCGMPARHWYGGLVVPSWRDVDRPYVPGSGGWVCQGAYCRVRIAAADHHLTSAAADGAAGGVWGLVGARHGHGCGSGAGSLEGRTILATSTERRGRGGHTRTRGSRRSCGATGADSGTS